MSKREQGVESDFVKASDDKPVTNMPVGSETAGGDDGAAVKNSTIRNKKHEKKRKKKKKKIVEEEDAKNHSTKKSKKKKKNANEKKEEDFTEKGTASATSSSVETKTNINSGDGNSIINAVDEKKHEVQTTKSEEAMVKSATGESGTLPADGKRDENVAERARRNSTMKENSNKKLDKKAKHRSKPSGGETKRSSSRGSKLIGDNTCDEDGSHSAALTVTWGLKPCTTRQHPSDRSIDSSEDLLAILSEKQHLRVSQSSSSEEGRRATSISITSRGLPASAGIAFTPSEATTEDEIRAPDRQQLEDFESHEMSSEGDGDKNRSWKQKTRSSDLRRVSVTTLRGSVGSSSLPGAIRVRGIDSERAFEDDVIEGDFGVDLEDVGTAPAAVDKDERTFCDHTEPTEDPSERYLAPHDAKILAVANIVDEDEELGMFAIEYDPDAKPPIYKTRRFRLYASISFLVIVVVAIGAAIGATLGQKNDDVYATAAPTSYRESIGIQAEVISAFGSHVLRDPNSPYSKALDWITFDDPLQLTPDAPNFIQRFVASYFYYATTIDGLYRSCNPNDAWSGGTRCTFSKLNAMTRQFVNSTSNAWLSNITECNWAGITCDEQGQVRSIDLPGQGLSGTFPEGIYHWPFLQSVVFSAGTLRGPLPAQLADMQSMVSIVLSNNKFTGYVPENWWKATNLQRINLSTNKITGTLATEVGNLVDLKDLGLAQNRISGVIPSELGMLESLVGCDLGNNNLEGPLPPLGNWKAMDTLWLQQNELTGTISEAIGTLTNLKNVKLDNNLLSGTLPDSLFDLPSLLELDLYDCDFGGTLSPKIGQLTGTLEVFRISNNNFSGQIPSEFALLIDLAEVWLHGNDFTGSVPQEFCALDGGTETSGVLIDDFIADCAANEEGYIELGCSCCSHCCQPDGTSCLPNFPAL